MNKKKITCTSCKKQTEVEFSNIGDMERESKYKAMFDMDCRVCWLCENCFPIAEKLAKELIAMLDGNDIVPLCSLYKNKK